MPGVGRHHPQGLDETSTVIHLGLPAELPAQQEETILTSGNAFALSRIRR
jgi:hypothetical protein